MVEERKITLLLTFSIANHCIPKKFEFPQSPAPSPSVVHSLPWTNGSNRSCQRNAEQSESEKKKGGEKFSWWTAWGFQTAASSAADLKPPTLRNKATQKKNKTMKKWKFSALRIWVIIPKHEGCGFPWKAFTVGLLTLPPSVGSWKTFHSDGQPSWITLLRFFFKVASVLGIVGEISSSPKSLRAKKVWKTSYAPLHDGILGLLQSPY